jgi:succinate dehydrogenase / fumarate reductase membrane anchor subunit
MRTGMLEVIEDYIHKPFTKTLLVLGNTFIAAGLWLITAFALLKLAL